MVAQIAAGLTGQSALLAHGRGAELEADEYGARYTSAAGYDPKGIATFFEKIRAEQGSTPAFLTFLSSHPATEERISKVNQYVAQNNLTGSDLGADRIAAIKAKLKARPQPPEPKAVPGQTPATTPTQQK
jgi:predicted Zn-dependent protease